jgi:hypothetical protein
MVKHVLRHPVLFKGRIIGGVLVLKNPLDTLTGTIVCGLIITIVLYVIVKSIPVGA